MLEVLKKSNVGLKGRLLEARSMQRKIFNEWRAGRQIKEVNSAEDGFDNVRPIQPLTTSLAEMHVTSLAFWLSKFVGEAANSKGERYPSRTLYCIMCGLNKHLSDVSGLETVNILDKGDRRYVTVVRI